MRYNGMKMYDLEVSTIRKINAVPHNPLRRGAGKAKMITKIYIFACTIVLGNEVRRDSGISCPVS